MDAEEKVLREAIMDCLCISGEYDAEWTDGYIDIGSTMIMEVVNELVALVRQREQKAYQEGQGQGRGGNNQQ